MHTQGKTIEEVKKNLPEAIKMIIESNIRHFISDAEIIIEEDIAVEV